MSTRSIAQTLYDAFGQRQVSTIYNPLNQYRVVMEAAPEFWQDPEALRYVYVAAPAATGAVDTMAPVDCAPLIAPPVVLT